ncbi:MAG: arylsulfatase [Bacteroidota bacterium]
MNPFSKLLIAILAGALTQCQQREEQPTRQTPNIIVILADDFGVGDIQAHYPENKIPTPHLDRLVSEGMSFTDAHSSSAVCSPTRYGLLTGRYNWRSPLQEWVLASYEPPLIKDERTTLPEMLQENGYATACVGKWHLGMNWPGEQKSIRVEQRHALNQYTWDYSQPTQGGPIDHGFDYYFGVHLPNFPPFTYMENDRLVVMPTDTFHYEPYAEMVMPRIFEGAPMAPGWKFEDILPDITERAVQYIHDQSQGEKPFFLYFSMTSPHEPISPSERFQGKSGIAPIADFVMETDWSVGEILQAVDDAGIAENTLVIFTADNGHSHYTGWEKLIEAGHAPSGPYRGHKGDIWEGGHRVPLIAKWPNNIPAASQSEQLVCLTDLYATCQALVSKELPPAGNAEDSFSFLEVLLAKEESATRDHIVNHSRDGEFAYREAGWKLVYKLPEANLNASRGKAATVELYHLGADIAEAQELAQQHPEKVQELRTALEKLVTNGASRPGIKRGNDVHVRFDTIQEHRWAEEIH